jgi:hypothetical protein
MTRKINPQDISWFLDLYRKKQIDLDPPYQRRSVWTPKDRRYFLDTIFRNYASPAVFHHKTMDDNGVPLYHVVDGKQRIETIAMFAGGKIALDKELTDTSLRGKKFKDLNDDQRKAFWDYVLIVEMLDTVEGAVVDEIFARVNRNARKLERQELRHAKYDGWFITFVEGESEKEVWKKFHIVTTARAKRMKDVQFLSELFLVILDGRIVGFDQDYLDDKYVEYDSPDESVPDFSEEEFSGKVSRIKDYFSQMESYNASITTHAKSFINFYSIWSIVALNLDRLPQPEELAKRYASFMERVAVISTYKPEDIVTTAEDIKFREPYNYLVNSKGAATDFTPRENRHSALKTELGLKNEDTAISS